MKQWMALVLAFVMALTVLTGCKKEKDTPKEEKSATSSSQEDKDSKKDEKKDKTSEGENAGGNDAEIHVITREAGSGTRGAFTEITKILSKDSSGKEVDNTYIEATVTNSTATVVTTVEGDPSAIGYISLASLKDNVKAVTVEGAKASAEDIKNKTYPLSRPFNLVYKEDKLSDAAKDFLNFIFSEEGAKIIEKDGCIPVDRSKTFKGSGVEGSITIAGSTSVTPLMELLVDAYKERNPKFHADIQANGSSAGIQAATEGMAEIGMASRELKDSEKSAVQSSVMAMDGIAVIVNKANPIENLTMDQIHKIFTGEIRNWKDVK